MNLKSVVECLHGICEALGSILSAAWEDEEREKEEEEDEEQEEKGRKEERRKGEKIYEVLVHWNIQYCKH